MIQKPPTLNDYFTNWKTGKGIFYYLSIQSAPWEMSVDSKSLDMLYHGNTSGSKYISPLVENIALNPISDSDGDILAECAMAMFGNDWSRLWTALQTEYNPLENYNSKEVMTDNKTVYEYGKTNTRTDDLVHTFGKSTTRTDDLTHTDTGTDTETPNITNTVENSVYGFNSTSYVPSSKETTTTNGNNTTERDHTLKDTGTVVNADSGSDKDTGTVQYADTGSDTQTNSYTMTRQGNIGVTTSQQMLESEYELRKRNYFRDVVFADLDKLLTLNIY